MCSRIRRGLDRRAVVLSAGLAAAMIAGGASADLVSIGVTLNGPDTGSLQLTGQSSIFKTTTGGMSTGGQLDDVSSPGAVVEYTEVFPPPTLADYQSFGYFGRVLTKDANDQVIDTSFIMAFQPGEGVGRRIEEYFAGNTEAQLVAALATFDSPEFLNLLSAVPDNALTRGDIEVLPIGRPGQTLDLVAFTGGVDGDLGVVVGSLTFAVVPAPASGLVMLAGGAMLARRRR